MKILLSFVLFVAAFSLSFAASAKSKSEPVPVPHEDQVGSEGDDNTPGSFEETYEGNDRAGEEDGYEFSANSAKVVTEDRGSVVVVTTTRPRDAFPGDKCAFVTVQILDKKSGEVLKSDSIRTCQDQVL